jgi:periplasmic protein TonB
MNRRAGLAFLLCMGLSTVACTTQKEEAAKTAVPKEAPASPEVASGETTPQPETSFIPVDEMPKVIDARVTYPEEAKKNGEEGTIYIKARVGKDGTVAEAMVDSQHTGSAALETAALEAVRQWTFTPAKSKGEPVEVWIVVPVKFKLQ